MNNVSAYALRLGDNGLVLSQRLGARCGHAPELEIDPRSPISALIRSGRRAIS